MKKHIIGLTLFSIIVGTAIFIYGMFNVVNVEEEVFVITNTQTYPTTKSCRKFKEELKDSNLNKLMVKQAVLNLQTKQFNWELATPDIDEPIALHFFSKDGNGTRYITSEQINNKFSHNGILRYSSSYNWLNKRKSYENLYVIAQFKSDAVNYSENYQVYGNKFQPKFDASKATAVTVDYGE
jgi:hypothetical protein